MFHSISGKALFRNFAENKLSYTLLKFYSVVVDKNASVGKITVLNVALCVAQKLLECINSVIKIETLSRVQITSVVNDSVVEKKEPA